MIKLTRSGIAFNMLHSKSSMVCIEDVAWHLAHINRWGGACRRAMSVAEHALLVVYILERSGAILNPMCLRAALHHDSEEYITNDMCTMSKRLVGDAWHNMARGIKGAVEQHFGISDAARTHRIAIKYADNVAAATELRDLMPPVTDPELIKEFAYLDGVEPVREIDLNDRAGMDAQDWYRAFLDKHEELAAMCEAANKSA
ncbi:MAG: hypothetical protein ACRCV9_09800, partial [Burkholderiaceae bacterium]